jgi:hypothetical protein
MQVSIKTAASVFVGIVIMDYLTTGKLSGLAAKVFGGQQVARSSSLGCGCDGACADCAKNVTDRAQVVDMKPLSNEVRAS